MKNNKNRVSAMPAINSELTSVVIAHRVVSSGHIPQPEKTPPTAPPGMLHVPKELLKPLERRSVASTSTATTTSSYLPPTNDEKTAPYTTPQPRIGLTASGH